MRIKRYYSLNMSFFFNCDVVWRKIRKFLNLEELDKMMNKQSNLKKNVHLKNITNILPVFFIKLFSEYAKHTQFIEPSIVK